MDLQEQIKFFLQFIGVLPGLINVCAAAIQCKMII